MINIKRLKVVCGAELAAEPLFVVEGELSLLVVEDKARSLRAQEKPSLEMPQGEILTSAYQEGKLVAGRTRTDHLP